MLNNAIVLVPCLYMYLRPIFNLRTAYILQTHTHTHTHPNMFENVCKPWNVCKLILLIVTQLHIHLFTARHSRYTTLSTLKRNKINLFKKEEIRIDYNAQMRRFSLAENEEWLSSPVDFRSNPEMSCLNRQDKPLGRKFSALYDGISCQFVGVEQFSQSKKL